MSVRAEKNRVLKFHGGSLTKKVLMAENRYYIPTHRRAVRAMELGDSTWNLRKIKCPILGKSYEPLQYPTRTHHDTREFL